MLIPLGLAFQQIQILQQQLPPPNITDLFVHRPVERLAGSHPGGSASVWCLRRLLGWCFPKNKIWGVERPALETWTAILAFAPVIGWLGNPAWWRETLRASPTITRSTSTANIRFPTSRSSTSVRSTNSAFPGITDGF